MNEIEPRESNSENEDFQLEPDEELSPAKRMEKRADQNAAIQSDRNEREAIKAQVEKEQHEIDLRGPGHTGTIDEITGQIRKDIQRRRERNIEGNRKSA